MKLYLASAGGIEGLEHYPKLEAFAYKSDAIKALNDEAPFFLDSGAFTEFNTGKQIDIYAYADFIKEYEGRFDVASSLDNIYKEEQKSYANLKLLESLGCKVAPVFHCREDFKWLQRYLDEGYDYILLGGMVPESSKWIEEWLDYLWEHMLTNPDGTAKVKIHGFGMTVLHLMKKYPWYSVDSSSWTYGGRFGVALIPVGHENSNYVWVYFGENHSSRKQLGGSNYWTFDVETRLWIDNYLLKFDITPKKLLEEGGTALNKVNVATFMYFAKLSVRVHFKPSQIGLFDAF